MSLLSPSQVIRKFFDGLDLHKIDADLRLANLQHHCTKNRDPKTCFLTVAFTTKNNPTISWGFRLEKLFGKKEIDFQGYLDLVHPAWKDYYAAMAEAAYTIAFNNPNWAELPEACYIVNVPLRKVGGKEYHWFRQLSIPALINPDSGMLAAHLNYYTDLGPYDDHLPEAPTVYALFPEDSEKEELDQLRFKFANLLPNYSFTLTQFLSAQQKQILNAYRQHLCKNAEAPSITELMDLLQLSSQPKFTPKELKRKTISLSRARTRLATALGKHLKTKSPLADPAVFAQKLNLFFGCPDETTSGQP